MRTTLSIDDDVLNAAKELATVQHKTIGEVISSLARQALSPPQPSKAVRNGIPLLPVPAGAPRVTPELVRELLEDVP